MPDWFVLFGVITAAAAIAGSLLLFRWLWPSLRPRLTATLAGEWESYDPIVALTVWWTIAFLVAIGAAAIRNSPHANVDLNGPVPAVTSTVGDTRPDIATRLAESIARTALVVLPLQLAALLLFVNRRGLSLNPRDALSTRTAAAAGIGVLYLLAVYPVVMLLHTVCRSMLQSQPVHPLEQLLKSDPSLSTIVLVVLAAGIGAPLVEELLFRGIVQRTSAKYLGFTSGLLLSSLLFAAVHAGVWPDPVPLFLLAIALGLAQQHAGSIWAPIAAHAVFNLLSIVLAVWWHHSA